MEKVFSISETSYAKYSKEEKLAMFKLFSGCERIILKLLSKSESARTSKEIYSQSVSVNYEKALHSKKYTKEMRKQFKLYAGKILKKYKVKNRATLINKPHDLPPYVQVQAMERTLRYLEFEIYDARTINNALEELTLIGVVMRRKKAIKSKTASANLYALHPSIEILLKKHYNEIF